jgi:hypothetical protein
MSIVGGVRYNTKNVQLDYSDCEENFLPYYPNMADARRVSNKVEEIICVPTNHFFESRLHMLQKHISKAQQKVRERLRPGSKGGGANPQNYYSEWGEIDASPRVKRLKNVFAPYLTGRHLISNIGQLDYDLLKEMLASIRRRARASRLAEVPVILENHTKVIQNFSHIERFTSDVAKSDDIKCVTLTELSRELLAGRFPIKIAPGKLGGEERILARAGSDR